jgi:hypothetical protein
VDGEQAVQDRSQRSARTIVEGPSVEDPPRVPGPWEFCAVEKYADRWLRRGDLVELHRRPRPPSATSSVRPGCDVAGSAG